MTSWPPKDWRALLALLGSIGGAAALTAFLAYGYWLNVEGSHWTVATEEHRAHTARWILWIVSGGIVLVLFSLGMAINRRSFKGTFGKASLGFEGGEAEDTTAPALPDLTAASTAVIEVESSK
jgi:hypothetical protein